MDNKDVPRLQWRTFQPKTILLTYDYDTDT